MNKKIIKIILLIGVCFFVWQNFFDEPIQEHCSQETKICSDGSYVSRVNPNCEFAECPEVLPSFGNSQIEKAITDYLLTQEYFSWKTVNDSFNLCAIENLNSEKELFPLYVWVYCGEYIVQDNNLKNLSGLSVPIKINYPNELSFYDLSKFSYEAPRDGSYYSEDVAEIFPENLQEIIFNFNRKNIIEKGDNNAFANILSWEAIKQAINNCGAEKVFQFHDRSVVLNLKNGNELTAIEPNIDDIIVLASEAETNCGNILLGTE